MKKIATICCIICCVFLISGCHRHKPIKPKGECSTYKCSKCKPSSCGEKHSEGLSCQGFSNKCPFRGASLSDEIKEISNHIGKWKTKTTFWMGPKQKPMVITGVSIIKPILGGTYLEETFYSDDSHKGQPFFGRGSIGYNPRTGKYESTWLCSKKREIFISKEGVLQNMNNSQVLTMKGKMPMHNGKITPVHLQLVSSQKESMVFTIHDVSNPASPRKVMAMEYERIL